MTKSNRFLLTGAAVAGLLAGTSASIQASNLAPGGKASASAQDTEKSCKGKGGCATDGSKMPEEKPPA